MALIGTIRKNGWILIVLLAMALGGFVLMDIVQNASNYSAGDINTLGKVNGKEIKRSELETYQSLIYTNADNPYQARQQSWEYFVKNALFSQEAEALGLGVDREELRDLQFGDNLSPIITSRYRTPEGLPDFNYLNQVKSAIDAGQLGQADPRFVASWAEQEKEVIADRLEDKVMAMINKGLYTPKWLAEVTFRESNERRDFAYLRIPFDKVSDTEAPVTDADYKAFLKDNPKLYTQLEETRVIMYVPIDVVPTANDSSLAYDGVAKLLDGLRNTDNDSVFVLSNNGTYSPAYKTKSELSPTMGDSLMKLPLGTIFGPYLDGGAWNIAKIIDRKVVPDSVRVSHIALQNTPENAVRIDSLLDLLNTGKARFDSLASQFSQDTKSATEGGDLGWIGRTAEGNDLANLIFYQAEPGKNYRLENPQVLQIVRVTDRKFDKNETGLRAVFLSQKIEPSKSTQQAMKDKAQALVLSAKNLDDLTAQAGEQNLQVLTSGTMNATDFMVGVLGSGDDAREIVRWAFDKKTKVNSVAQEVFSFRDQSGGYFDSRYVVAALKSITPKGPASVATLKAIPEADQKVKNLKKAEVITGKMLQAAGDLAAIAATWAVPVDTARGATMIQVGSDPRVVGTAFALDKGVVSPPITSNSGVYVVLPLTDKPQIQVPADLTMFKRQASSSAQAVFRMGFVESMKKAAEVADFRSRFY
ncbi:MAG: SurA N-terminal domain-containing protein [Saprospiraceae bacterium]|nr:SurA N-terminal domain-containing protein [Saprospiraceae bacterium]